MATQKKGKMTFDELDNVASQLDTIASHYKFKGSNISAENTINRDMNSLTIYGRSSQINTPNNTSPVGIDVIGSVGNVELVVSDGNNVQNVNIEVIGGLASNGLSYKDKIIKINGVWYIQRNSIKFTLDENQAIAQGSTIDPSKKAFWFPNTSVIGSENFAISNKLRMGDWYNKQESVMSVDFTNGRVYFYIDEVAGYDVTAMRAWLGTNNIEFYLPLGEPTLNELPNEEQTLLNSLYSYGGVTNITADDAFIVADLYANNNAIIENTPQGEGIACFGDSLTYSQYAENTTYPSELSRLLGDVDVYNYGVPGETYEAISARQGGVPMVVYPFVIPTTKTTTPIDLKTANGEDITIARYDNGLNPCYIKGIKGKITYSGGQYYFSRLLEGAEVNVAREIKVVSEAMKNRRSSFPIIWAGSNNNPTGEETEDLINAIKSMINYNCYDNGYLVLGITSDNVTDRNVVNVKLAKAFGENFIDLRHYLIKYGLADAGITPTTQDLTDIGNDIIPTSLRYDSVHFNDSGYNVIALWIHEKGKELGYWS